MHWREEENKIQDIIFYNFFDIFALNPNFLDNYSIFKFFYADDILGICREVLKNYIDVKMKEGEIACSDANEIIKSMVDYTGLEQWKQSGLSTDDFFMQNAIALTSTKR